MRLTQHSTTGRPAIGRSATHVGRRSFGVATAPQPGQPTGPVGVSIMISSSPPASAAASTSNPSRPNTSASTAPPESASAAAGSIASAPTWGPPSILVISSQ